MLQGNLTHTSRHPPRHRHLGPVHGYNLVSGAFFTPVCSWGEAAKLLCLEQVLFDLESTERFLLSSQGSRLFPSCLPVAAMCDGTFPPHLPGGMIIPPCRGGLGQINPLARGRWHDTTMRAAPEIIMDKLVLLSSLATSQCASFDSVAAPFVLKAHQHSHDWSWLSTCLRKTNSSSWLPACLCCFSLTLKVILSQGDAAWGREEMWLPRPCEALKCRSD